MAKKGKYRTRVESVHEEENHEGLGGWGANWDQGEWGQGGNDQSNLPNTFTNAHDNDVQPGDSISNTSSFEALDNVDWKPSGPAPTPPSKDIPMLHVGPAWPGAVPGAPSTSAMKTYGNHSDLSAAHGMQNMLGAIIQQRQTQHEDITELLNQKHQQAQDLALAHQLQAQNNAVRRQGRHRREESWGGTWGQTSDVGTAYSKNHSGGQVGWDDGWTNDGPKQQTGWAAEGANTIPKSRKKRKKREGQQASAHTKVANNDNAWGDSSWGGTGGWDSVPSGAAATSVTPGGFGSNNAVWGSLGANANDIDGGGWGTQEPQAAGSKGKTPKVTITAPSTVGEETILSSKSQSGLSGILGRIFKSRKKKDMTREVEVDENAWAEEPKEKQKKKGKEKHVQIQEQGKKGKILKRQKYAESDATAWPAAEKNDGGNGGGWGEVGKNAGWGERDKSAGWGEGGQNAGWGEERLAGVSSPAVASKASDAAWDNAPLANTSRAYAFATEGRLPDKRRSRSESQAGELAFAESHGDALLPARRALFSKERLARDRILWFFDPRKDMRVSYVMDWIQYRQSQLATFGFSKFIESRERGALFTNVDYLASSREPMFDWLTYDRIQPTMDRILQESLAFHDPSSQILVFVFLLSKSKSSMAIWRRKLPLPENIRITYGTHIQKVVANLNKQYPIHVDEMPKAVRSDLNRSGSATRGKWLRWVR